VRVARLGRASYFIRWHKHTIHDAKNYVLNGLNLWTLDKSRELISSFNPSQNVHLSKIQESSASHPQDNPLYTKLPYNIRHKGPEPPSGSHPQENLLSRNLPLQH
jgi:hypothetical protein